MLEALRAYGGDYGVLTIEQLYYVYLDKVRPRPLFGELSGNEPGSSFAFVVAESALEAPVALEYGDLTVSVVPADALVTLSVADAPLRGRSTQRADALPGRLRRFHVAVGAYVLHASRAGYREVSRVVTIEQGAATVEVRLDAE